MIRPIFKGRVSKGKLTLDLRAKFDELLRGLGDCEIELTIQVATKLRSLDQNRFYNGVVLPLLIEFTGHDRDEMHMELRRRFLNGRSTATLSTSEFRLFIEDCQRFGAEMNCRIPDPGEVEWDWEMSA